MTSLRGAMLKAVDHLLHEEEIYQIFLEKQEDVQNNFNGFREKFLESLVQGRNQKLIF